MTGQRLFGRLVSDSAVYGLAATVAKALALLTVPYLTRSLSPAGYGVADLATSTAALLTLFAMFSGDIPAARDFGLATDERLRHRILSSYLWATAALSVALAVGLMALTPVIASELWGSKGLTFLASLSLVLVPLSAVQAALVQTQRIRGRPSRFAALSLVDLLAQLGLAVALVAAGMGPAGVVIGFIVGSLIGLLLAAAAARETLRVEPEWLIARQMVTRGAQFLPYVTMFVLADWAVRSIVANAMGPAAVAELAVAIRVASLLTLLGAAFAMAWGPIGLARSHGSATANLFGHVLGVYGAASVTCALVLAAIGPELLLIIAGPGYEGAAVILPGFALAFAIAGTEYVLVVAAGVSDRASRVALAATVGAAVQIVGTAALVPVVGIAAIGPMAVMGRTVSFAILLTGLRASIVIPLSRVIALGVLAGLAFVAIQAAIGGQDAIWVFARRGLAISFAAIALVLMFRVLRADEPMAA